MFSRPKILFLVSLLFVRSTQSLEFFCFLYMLSTYDDLSAGAQNVTGTVIIMLVYKRLLTMCLHDKAAV